MSLSKVVQVRVNTIMEVLSCLMVGMQWSEADYNLALECLEKELHPQPKTRGRKPAAKTADEAEPEPEFKASKAPKAPKAPKASKAPKALKALKKAVDVDVVQKRIDELPQLEVPVRGKKLYFQKSKVQYYRFEGDDEVFDRKTGDIAGTWDEVFHPLQPAPAPAPVQIPAPAPAPAYKPYHFQRNKIQYTRLQNGDVADRKTKTIVGYWNADLNNLVLDLDYSAGK